MNTPSDYLKQHRERFLEELRDFVRIPSVSALPDHAVHVETAAKWVSSRLEAAGVEHVRILATDGHPVVYGDWLHAPGKPTILIYGHFDVQPADPVELWDTPPFEPTVREGRLYGRGASDDKGNMLVPILAVEALLKTHGTAPVNLKFLLEGQEEIGSPDLPGFMRDHAETFAADLAVSADGSQWSEDQAATLMSLRGICALQIDVQGPNRDLHSGMYGGAVRNPIHALSVLVAGLHDENGRVTVPGFYDNVVELTKSERADLARIPFDKDDYLQDLEIPATVTERGYSPREGTWVRPTLEVNGIWGGFQGDGVKTVLPAHAHAKLTCRLVADQKPERILSLLEDYVADHQPVGTRATTVRLGSTGDPYSIPTDHPGNLAAKRVLHDLYGKEPFAVRTGGSIPICGLLLKHLGLYTVSFAFGLGDERAHSPNEFYRLSSFDRGQEAYLGLLNALSELDLTDPA